MAAFIRLLTRFSQSWILPEMGQQRQSRRPCLSAEPLWIIACDLIRYNPEKIRRRDTLSACQEQAEPSAWLRRRYEKTASASRFCGAPGVISAGFHGTRCDFERNLVAIQGRVARRYGAGPASSVWRFATNYGAKRRSGANAYRP